MIKDRDQEVEGFTKISYSFFSLPNYPNNGSRRDVSLSHPLRCQSWRKLTQIGLSCWQHSEGNEAGNNEKMNGVLLDGLLCGDVNTRKWIDKSPSRSLSLFLLSFHSRLLQVFPLGQHSRARRGCCSAKMDGEEWTPRVWPKWWRPWSWGLLSLRSKVQHLMGANCSLGPSDWGFAPWINRGALAGNSLPRACAPLRLVGVKVQTPGANKKKKKWMGKEKFVSKALERDYMKLTMRVHPTCFFCEIKGTERHHPEVWEQRLMAFRFWHYQGYTTNFSC